jgi:hypothetical protein
MQMPMHLWLLDRLGWLALGLLQGSAHWGEMGRTPTRLRWGVCRRTVGVVGRSLSSWVCFRRSALCALYMSGNRFVGAVLICPLPGLLAPDFC